MRGTHIRAKPPGKSAGIIPAHAGNTTVRIRRGYSARDHPRACGEHAGKLTTENWNQGSSPRMRGTRVEGCDVLGGIGIIPAHAGNTGYERRKRRHSRDHPRACGEHMPGSPPWDSSSGSSPRMRGTLIYFRFPCCGIGIIPAHAGNTMPCC